MGTPSLQRPQKIGNVRTYVDEVNYLAPADAPILAPEVDADLATLYNAWNDPASAFPPTGAAGGDLAGSTFPNCVVGPGKITRAKTAPDCWLPPAPGAGDVGSVLVVASGPALAWQQTPGGPWSVSGGNITPTDPTKNVLLPGGMYVAGSGFSTTRVLSPGGLSCNASYSTGWREDDPSKPGWMMQANAGSDSFGVWRMPPSNGALTQILTLDAAGSLTVGNNVLANGTFLGLGWAGQNRGGLQAYPSGAGTIVEVYANYGQQLAGRPVWEFRLDTTNDLVGILRQAPNGGAWTQPFGLDAFGNLALNGDITRVGNGVFSGIVTCSQAKLSGIRCSQGGGSLSGGYSNQIGFGWTGAQICAAVDNIYTGTINITPPSDERLKRDVQEDVPGLDAVRALRPVSFTYDQAMKSEVMLAPGRHYGLIAQEAQPHVPLAIEDDGSAAHYLALDYRTLVPVLIGAIQELAARVTALEAPPRMIQRAQIEARLATLREQREVQGRQLFDLQQALRATERSVAQLDGALLVLQEVLGETAEGEA